jgi:hypothetical protein
VIASVHQESDQTVLEFVFQVIPPGSEDYEAALESEYASEARQGRTVESAVLGALREHIPVDEQPGLLVEDGISLVDIACWMVGGWYLTFGVEHADPEDMPILLMARLRPQR